MDYYDKMMVTKREKNYKSSVPKLDVIDIRSAQYLIF